MALVMKSLLLPRLAALFLCFMFVSFAHAQADKAADIQAREDAIAQMASDLDAGELDLLSARDQLRILRTESRLAVEQITRNNAILQQQLSALGPAPEASNIEPPEVYERRSSLTMESARMTALTAQARLNGDDVSRLLSSLAERERAAFFDEVFKTDRSALRASLWTEAADGIRNLTSALHTHVHTWREARIADGALITDLAKLLGVLGFSILLFWPLRRWINSALSTTLLKHQPSEFDRYIALFSRILIRVLPGVIGGIAIIGTLDATGLLTPDNKPFAYTVWQISLICLAADGMAVGLFAPRETAWRVIPLTDSSARRARWLSVLAVLIASLGHLVSAAAFVEDGARQLTGGTIVTEAILVAIVIAFAALPSTWQMIPERSDAISAATKKRWTYLRRIGPPVIFALIATMLLGYLNLAAFITTRAVMFIGLVAWIWVGRKAIMSGLRTFDQSIMARRLDSEAPSRKAMLFWAGLIVDLFVLIATAPMIAILIGIKPYTVQSVFMDALTGITISNFTLSLSDIFSAIVTFFVILLTTRFLQRALDTRLFANTGADEGLRNSFRTLLGYAGLIIAIFAAIGVIGLNLSNLAIIAGALSVGIGFGLQSIVNNFVSGLILLFERPVKVGDWVVTTSGEGYIRKISVRSTEIETFDRASVIVPNSELISNSVKNWTHKDRGGRISVPVGVAYGSDMKKVREILYKIADEQKHILKTPPPFVYFKEFGESSLDIELRFFISNMPDILFIRNEVRFAILEAFHEHGIEIPFPQRDLHIKPAP